MKALDTNALVRLLVRDDEGQASKVKRLLREAQDDKIAYFVTIPVLIELLWVLDAVYGCSREEIVEALEGLILLSTLRFERPETVHDLIEKAKRSRTDLPDILIGLVARTAGFETTLTFDKEAGKSDLFEML